MSYSVHLCSLNTIPKLVGNCSPKGLVCSLASLSSPWSQQHGGSGSVLRWVQDVSKHFRQHLCCASSASRQWCGHMWNGSNQLNKSGHWLHWLHLWWNFRDTAFGAKRPFRWNSKELPIHTLCHKQRSMEATWKHGSPVKMFQSLSWKAQIWIKLVLSWDFRHLHAKHVFFSIACQRAKYKHIRFSTGRTQPFWRPVRSFTCHHKHVPQRCWKPVENLFEGVGFSGFDR